MDKLIKSTEQLALGLAVAILCLSGLSFSLSHQLGEEHQTRFLFSGIVLGLTSAFLRFGFIDIQPLHRASYRLALVMMVWAIGFYFFPYPQFILYLVTLPALYFLMRVEIKKHLAPKEDLIATGILLALAIFLYLQQQPLQMILFDNPEVDWTVYYLNAPCMLLVGLAFLRLQYWVKWDGLALMGCFILLLAAVLSLSDVLQLRWLQLKELVLFAVLAHGLMAFTFIPNLAFNAFCTFIGMSDQQASFKRSVFAMVFLFAQLSLVLIVQFFWGDPVIAKSLYQIWAESNGNAFWYISLVLGCLLLMVYEYRSWTVSLLLLELAVVGGVVALKLPFYVLGLSGNQFICGLLALALLSMGYIKRQPLMAHTIRLWAFIGVLAAYGFVFYHSPMFTPLGFIGFILPVLAWAYFPDKPTSPIRNVEYFAWPILVLIGVLCFSKQDTSAVLTPWALITVALPLSLSVLLANQAMQQIVDARRWSILKKWRRLDGRLLPSYALLGAAIGVASFLLNNNDLALHWNAVLWLCLVFVVCSCSMLSAAIRRQRISLYFLSEILLWGAMALVRWKLDRISALAIGSAIDGYIFIGIAVLVAGIREKAKQHNSDLAAYFTKTTLFYSVLGWLYLIYLYWNGGAAIHGELASLGIAGVLYWLSRDLSRKIQILVFIFVNIGLFVFFDDIALNNALFYITPALGSALIMTHLFKDELTAFQVKQIRFYCGLILLGVSAAYNILDFKTSVWYPATAVIMSAFVVVLGISLRIRIFLYLGGAFFGLNIIGMIANVIIHQPDGRTMFAVGVLFLAMGILFIGTYLLFQMKREEILTRYREVMHAVDAWET